MATVAHAVAAGTGKKSGKPTACKTIAGPSGSRAVPHAALPVAASARCTRPDNGNSGNMTVCTSSRRQKQQILKFKEHQKYTSSGRRVQSSRKRLENDGIAEEAATRKKYLGKAAMAQELKRKTTDGFGPPDLDLDSEG